jgi:tetratricopeptide (TPR) repeat protein/DNA-binding CsgD family transcriptional regulator
MLDTSDHITLLRERLSATTDRHERLEAYLELAEALRAGDAAASLQHAEKGLEIAQSLGREFEVALCDRQIGSSLIALGEYGRGYTYLHEAYRIFERREDRQAAVESALALGTIAQKQRKYRKALEWFEQALTTLRSIDDRRGESSALRALGSLHTEIRDDVKALACFHDALRIVEELDDCNAIGVVLSDIAMVHGSVGHHDRALDCFNRSRESFNRSGNHFLALRALTNIARTHLLCDRLDEALDCAERARTIYATLGDRESLATVLEIIGHVHEKRGEPERALDYQRKGLDLLCDVEDEVAQARVLLTIGRLFQQLGDHHEASLALEEALHIAEERTERGLQYQIHERLATTFKHLGNLGRSLRHHEQFASIREEVLGLVKQQSIAELQARFDLERAQKEMEIIRLEKEKLAQEVEHKTNELTAMALHLVEKNQFLDSLKKEMSDVVRAVDGEMRPAMKGLMRQVDTNINSGEDWQRFEAQFETVHPEFIKRLLERAPKLTPAELKVCALLKINMASKEIAELLKISSRTVEHQRASIRRKLKLGPDTNLAVYFASLQA